MNLQTDYDRAAFVGIININSTNLLIVKASPLARTAWASNLGSISVTTNSCNLEDGIDNTADTLARNEASRDSIPINVERRGVLLRPEVRRQGTNDHGGTVLSLWKNKGERDAHHVRMVLSDPLKTTDPDIVSDDDHDTAEDGEDNGKDATGCWDWEGRISDGDRNGLPCGDRGSGEGARFGFIVYDAGIGLAEEHKHCRCEKDGDNGADALCEPLLLGRCAEQETDAKVGNQISSLVRPDTGKSTAEQVEPLSVFGGPVLALGSTAEDDLGGFGCSSQRRNVRDTSALNGEEGEEEGQEDREDGHANWQVVDNSQDDADHDDCEDQAGHPHPHFYLVLLWRWVLDCVGALLARIFLEKGVLFAEPLAEIVHNLCKSTP